ncbi:MAG TPA: hypothetical protein VF861_01730 [Telluria sp.]
MNSPKLQSTQCIAQDALLDQLETELVALTTATLEDGDEVPTESVDEFSTDFLLQYTLRPG